VSIAQIDGVTVDTLAIATEDALLTVIARMSILGEGELAWLAMRCERHAAECRNDDPLAAAERGVLLAVVKLINGAGNL
jgi:hypothetical protein